MDKEEKPMVPKTATDMQKMKLEKLMKNPDKPVVIPERPKEKKTHTVPEFVRNVMGSSAGAGSGEFHVYRHLRRKEYARQKMIEEAGHKEAQDRSYHQKLEENRKKMEEKTAKKRAKRLKKKQKLKQRKVDTKVSKDERKNSSDESDEESEEGSDRENINESDEEKQTSEH